MSPVLTVALVGALLAAFVVLLVLLMFRRRSPGADAVAALEAARSGVQLTTDQVHVLALHHARHARPVTGVVQERYDQDQFLVALPDGGTVRAVRSARMRQQESYPQPGEQVHVLVGAERVLGVVTRRIPRP